MAEKKNTLDLYPSGKKLKAINRPKVYEEISAQIKGLIEDGKLKNGDQLPPERELAKIFKVSRYSVREAIHSLQEQGVLKSRLGSGTYVVYGKEPSVAELLALAIESEKGKIKDVFEFRHFLEPHIAYLAGANASAEDIKNLEAILDRQRLTWDVARLNELGEDFHLALAKSTGNSIFYSVTVRINDILSKTRLEVSQDQAAREKYLSDHNEIFEAVKSRNSELAKKKMSKHLHSIERILGEDQS
ncbi:FadR/GntR family transcriptional regulator [Desulforhopalus singaporensis]|uniref:Transcriptional regulator, GntR family n=1 Tax=Desulforhopalus singaporensis TaxID=91360 RepID=A0A1H0KLH6_9BACT|nr:FadR/GntR family transcriptional regulator [Desulforhopalus singaporensis]SDO56621.1 transcriptional regulator, GntR family [Desulforhopalus singaporensis]